MAGLLDFMESPEGRMGLLQFGAAMMQPTRGGRFGEAFGNGLQGGVQGYSQMTQLQGQKEQRELLMQQRQMQIAQLKRQQELEANRQNVLGRIGQPKDMAPTVANAQNPQTFSQQDAMQRLLAMGDIDTVKALQGLAPKYGTPQTVMGPNGPMLVQLDQQGNARPLEGFSPYNEALDPRARSAKIEDAVAKAEALLPFEMRKARAGAGGSADRSLQPQYGLDAQGNPVLLQLGKDGTAVQTRLPDGVKLDRTWLAQQGALGREVGAAQGKAQASLPSDLAAAEQAIDVIDQIIEHPGREVATGFSSKVDPRNYIPGTVASDFDALNKQLQGKTFMEAYAGLKGGGQITEVEGKKAQEAIARLSTAQTEGAYLKAVKELRGIIETGMGRARQRAGAQTPASPETQERTAVRTGTRNGKRVVQYSDGSIEEQ